MFCSCGLQLTLMLATVPTILKVFKTLGTARMDVVMPYGGNIHPGQPPVEGGSDGAGGLLGGRQPEAAGSVRTVLVALDEYHLVGDDRPEVGIRHVVDDPAILEPLHGGDELVVVGLPADRGAEGAVVASRGGR